MGSELFLILYDRTYNGLRGNIDRLFRSDFEARLYCTAQNNVSIKVGVEYWIVIIKDNGSYDCYSERVYQPPQVPA